MSQKLRIKISIGIMCFLVAIMAGYGKNNYSEETFMTTIENDDVCLEVDDPIAQEIMQTVGMTVL